MGQSELPALPKREIVSMFTFEAIGTQWEIETDESLDQDPD